MSTPPPRSSRLAVACAVSALVLAVAFVLAHALITDRYLSRVSAERFHAGELGLPLQEVPLGIAADGQVWIRHALALQERAPGEEWRLRYTHIDNAPFGREVHWNSAWAWWLAGLGKLRAHFTDEPLPRATERVARWAQLPVFLGALALFTTFVWRRWGAGAAAVLALGMAGHRGFYEGFYPGYPDHHGLINAALLGLLLGALGMGFGWVRENTPITRADDTGDFARGLLPDAMRSARSAALFSGISGGIGLWFSAASTVVVIALIGFAGAAVSIVFRRRLISTGALPRPALWRSWGVAGAIASLACYLIEYAPSGFALRLEVNHPLYALAWWGGGELIAGLLEILEPTQRRAGAARRRGRLVLAVLAVASVPAALAIGGTDYFVPEQPFMKRLYMHVDELKPLVVRMQEHGFRGHVDLLIWQAAAAAGCFALLLPSVRRRAGGIELLAGLTLVSAAITALGWVQNRWLLTASASHLVLLSAWLAALREAPVSRNLRFVGILGFLAIATTGPYGLLVSRFRAEAKRDVQLGEAMELLYRDIADLVHRDHPQKGVVLLASPNASNSISYYGRFASLGTFYWENADGLRAAAEIWLAPTAQEAARLLRARRVTHVVAVNAYDFLPEYRHALNLAAGPDAAPVFGEGLLDGSRIPSWLRPLEYTVPPQFSRWDLRVSVYAIDFDAPEDLALWRVARHQLARGQAAAARTTLQAAAEAGSVDGMAALAWLLATAANDSLRDGKEALRWAKALVRLNPEDAHARTILAAASAENGLFPEANGSALYAMELAEAAGDRMLLARLTAHLHAYQAGQPWRER